MSILLVVSNRPLPFQSAFLEGSWESYPIYEKALGPEHTSVATCMENYAGLLIKMGRTELADQFQHRAAAVRAK